MELDRIKALSEDRLQELKHEAHQLIEKGDLAGRTHGEIMLSVIGAVSSSRQGERSSADMTRPGRS